MGVPVLPLFWAWAALCNLSSYALPAPIPTPLEPPGGLTGPHAVALAWRKVGRRGSDGRWYLTFWMCKKKDLRSEADGSSGSTSELVFQAEDRSLPVVRHQHVLEYSYRGGRLPCGIVRGVHFVGSAPVHVLNLNLLIARSWPGTMVLWRCGT
ncbi:hypothetical protein THAOC_01420 [Thalassiosira oceanica]|uniref:Uncharacterized protein n=1 Tax=Thalassiosira oceanica TaxID=159749 RepID=K0TIF5_THAOC|nr:hypothetical protein THAOC_01420 [Thalassiosira oceanica]|eukprot:EJK76799.1 hypothetical protein THAOC_01420 [Thalassiosira oceanica]